MTCYCVECRIERKSARDRRYRERHKAQLAAKDRAWRLRNLERIQAVKRSYYLRNRERILAKCRLRDRRKVAYDISSNRAA